MRLWGWRDCGAGASEVRRAGWLARAAVAVSGPPSALRWGFSVAVLGSSPGLGRHSPAYS